MSSITRAALPGGVDLVATAGGECLPSSGRASPAVDFVVRPRGALVPDLDPDAVSDLDELCAHAAQVVEATRHLGSVL